MLLSILAFSYTKSNAQVYHVRYGYDANGNRINRQIISLQKTNDIETGPHKNKVEGNEIIETIHLDNGYIKLVAFPNPIIDKVFIRHESDINFQSNYTITSISGTVLLSGIFMDFTTIPMDNFSSGLYILSIHLLDVNKTIQLKIVKQ